MLWTTSVHQSTKYMMFSECSMCDDPYQRPRTVFIPYFSYPLCCNWRAGHRCGPAPQFLTCGATKLHPTERFVPSAALRVMQFYQQFQGLTCSYGCKEYNPRRKLKYFSSTTHTTFQNSFKLTNQRNCNASR